MLLKERTSGHLVEVLDVQNLVNPAVKDFIGRLNIGEELPEPTRFVKSSLVFCSGEPLPKCWLDPHYRDFELKH